MSRLEIVNWLFMLTWSVMFAAVIISAEESTLRRAYDKITQDRALGSSVLLMILLLWGALLLTLSDGIWELIGEPQPIDKIVVILMQIGRLFFYIFVAALLAICAELYRFITKQQWERRRNRFYRIFICTLAFSFMAIVYILIGLFIMLVGYVFGFLFLTGGQNAYC